MSKFESTVKKLLSQVHEFENCKDKESKKLPSNCYFLDKYTILAYQRKTGDGRYPYSFDGRTLWAYSSGNITVEESLYNIFLDAREGKEPYLCFFAGEKISDENYFPVSLLGVARQPFENNVKRYTIFTPEAVYYFTETADFITCVRAFVDTDKRICLSAYIQNISSATIDTYISAYLNPFMRHANAEDFETKWYKSCTCTEYGYKFKITEYLNRESCLTHYAVVRVNETPSTQKTTSRFGFTGGTNESLNCSESLQLGKLTSQKTYTEFTDMAVAATMTPLSLKGGESYHEDYIMTVSDNEEEAIALACQNPDLDKYITISEENTRLAAIDSLGIRFTELNGLLENCDETFNNFIYNVTRQVEFCSRAKNYAGPFIGIRDIFQQVEAAIAWIPEYCRSKIVEALNFIGEDGRAPRQYSYPANPNTPPKMDLRAFIDQGVWIISTIYTYLAYTDDYSILDEECGYYKFESDNVLLCDKRDSVLEHLITIADFLISNLDENTGCLKALYGDWNDALDGLGKTQKEGQEFGNGVSVMASLQLYKNLDEMVNILQKIGKHPEKQREYSMHKETLKNSLIDNAIVSNGTERKILHGWGDDKSFFVGSYCDNDGEDRDGLTANAHWILSGLYKECTEILSSILKAYERLDSKYGYKTFEPYFSSSNDKVGRINRLPKGTAENGATYIHATLFAIWSLFEIGESKKAWEQIYKILPITHDFISTTPFVMPNSYIHNEERGFDGESMSDWFTGSGCVLVKALIGGAFGVQPTLDGIRINTATYMPCKHAEITLKVKGVTLELKYQNKNNGSREYTINGKPYALDDKGIYLSNTILQTKRLQIQITD